MPEQRCPACNKLSAVTTDDFAGRLQCFCQRCKEPFGDPETLPRLRCSCGKWLVCGVVEAGAVRVICSRCRVLAEMTPGGAGLLEASRSRPRREKVKPRRLTDAELIGMVEERWHLFRADRAWSRAEIAVGLRFDVFNRDSFTCRYCGRGPGHGVFLEADHVIPRAEGGQDTLGNLVTSCQDCNRGKSAKPLTQRIA